MSLTRAIGTVVLIWAALVAVVAAPLAPSRHLVAFASPKPECVALIKGLVAKEAREGPRLYYQAGEPTRNYEEMTELRLGTYNVFNLMEYRGKFEREGLWKFKQVLPSIAKPVQQLKGVAETIALGNPDILVLEEVEGLGALKVFADDYLGGRYVPLLIEGNDTRGIDIGFLIKKDLPFDLELHSHRNRVKDADTSDRIFSRDLPVLLVRKKGSPESRPVMAVIGTHFKSQRDIVGDPRSVQLRGEQVRHAVEIKGLYEERYGKNLLTVLAGDFNSDLPTSAEFSPLWRDEMRDVFDAAEKPVKGQERVTHTFHPHDGETKRSQMDAILISKSGHDAKIVKEAKVLRYFDGGGQEKPLPRTYEERQENPSDHFMVITTFDFKKIRSISSQAPDR